MTWADEVKAGEREVRRDLAKPYRDLVKDVRVVAQEAWTDRFLWGSWEEIGRVIRLYKPAFDQMPDPENRARQIRDVILHEFQHSFGHQHLQGGVTGPGWYGVEPLDLEGPDGLTINLPGLP